MKCFALSIIIGDGASPATGYRPKILTHLNPARDTLSCVMSAGVDGSPRLPWCVVHLNASEAALRAADADEQCIVLPAIALDETLCGAVANIELPRLIARLAKLGIEQKNLSATTTLRELVRMCGVAHAADFDENTFDAR